MDHEKKLEDKTLDEVAGGAKRTNPRLVRYYDVLDSLNGKTCKFCKKKFVKDAVIANYAGYESKVLRKFEDFGCNAVPCLYCDYWRNISDFE